MEITLKTPESWKDITLRQYVQLLQLTEGLNSEDELEIINYRLKQVAILNPEYSVEDLQKLTLSQLKEYFDSIEFINTDPVLENCKELKIDGKKYTFQDFKYITLEQWIDCEKFSNLNNAHKLIAIFYIKPEEYTPQELDIVSEWLLDAPATKYFWSISFFLFIHHALELAIKRYSEKTEKKINKMIRIAEISQEIDKKIKKVQSKFGFK